MRVMLLAGCLGLCGVARAQVFLEFDVPLPYFNSGRLSLADVIEDGHLDAAVGTPSKVHILAGDSTGVFTDTGIVLSAPLAASKPGPLSAADLNGDGHCDLVLLGNSVALTLLGDGFGGFAPATTETLSGMPFDHALADVDGNGTLDLIASTTDSAAQLLLGNGDGSLQPPEPLKLSEARATGVALADVDADGLIDLVTAHRWASALTTRLGKAFGRFAPPMATDLDQSPWGIALAPVTDGAQVDVVVAGGPYFDTVHVLPGDGTGAWLTPHAFPVPPGPTDVRAQDVDGDGLPELLTEHAEDDPGDPAKPRAVSLLHLDSGGLTEAQGASVGPCRGFDVGDADGDGVLDVVNLKLKSINVVPGDGAGQLQVVPQLDLGQANYAAAVVAADLDGDGHRDVAACSAGANSVVTLHGDGAGGFSAPDSLRLWQDPTPVDIAAVDLDGDGQMDLITSNSTGDSVGVLAGLPGGGYAPVLYVAAGDGPRDVEASDVNDDGLIDVVTANADGSVSSMLGGAAGRLKPPVSTFVGMSVDRLAISDIDGDGTPDVVVGGVAKPDVTVLLADGQGGWSVTSSVPLGGELFGDMAMDDLDADGYVDLVIARNSPAVVMGTLALHAGDGAGMFGAPVLTPMDNYSADLLLADVDANGFVDALASTDYPYVLGTGVRLYRSSMAGFFMDGERYLAGARLPRLATGEFNEDGAIDVVALDGLGGYMHVLLNRLGP